MINIHILIISNSAGEEEILLLEGDSDHVFTITLFNNHYTNVEVYFGGSGDVVYVRPQQEVVVAPVWKGGQLQARSTVTGTVVPINHQQITQVLFNEQYFFIGLPGKSMLKI